MTQEQVSLVLYHVLPKYYTLFTFKTTSNLVNTQASGSNNVYTINITCSNNQVNVSTGGQRDARQQQPPSGLPIGSIYDKNYSVPLSSLFLADDAPKGSTGATSTASSSLPWQNQMKLLVRSESATSSDVDQINTFLLGER
ncbi:fasciclin-like arabinogalactan protein 9 [Musa acuminata AAA Group]|uniref:fasciclin-like arabinogalactan protein 9 n=1 Tax=Musa acuminata AAA Group TaxID=214697 RepID=UPI0031D2773E